MKLYISLFKRIEIHVSKYTYEIHKKKIITKNREQAMAINKEKNNTNIQKKTITTTKRKRKKNTNVCDSQPFPEWLLVPLLANKTE